MTSTISLLASTSFFLALLSYAWSCVAMHNGSIKPSIISRFFWFVLSISNFLSYYSLDSGSGIYLALSGMIGAGVMSVLTIKHGHIEYKASDKIACAGACIAFLCYMFVPIKSVALISGLLTHLISGIPTYRRITETSKAENFTSWAIFAVASCCSLISVILEGKNVIFPLYFFIFDTAVTILIVLKHKPIKISYITGILSFVLKSA
ncbi:MAG: hypothetical protein P1U74_04300 [Legionellaceae bacterium]|nr:hypothetical protein [Legionellaceae bacterium]